MVSNWVQRRGPDRDMERRVRQIRELVRLCNSLHADVGLREILTQLADAVSSTIGFGIAAFNLIREGNERLEIAAVAGLAPPEYQQLVESPPRVDGVMGLMRAEFCISHSYYINHHYKYLMDSVESIAVMPPLPPGTAQPPDAWHPDDMLLVPLVSPRDGRWLGILSLDQPEDGKVPTVETIEVVELFANQAAIAIDMATLFEEREHERRAIESGLITLLYHMEQVGRGNLAVRTEMDGTALSPIAETLNAVLSQLSGVLADVRGASEVVSRSATEMQAAATSLAAGARQQAQQILEVSSAVAGMAEGVRHISETASSASTVAEEAIAISHEGREAAERAAAGMTGVREMTLQSAKKMKRLGESTQEIGAIVQMVSDFANQTNLLALNAAIEAARAGEHGRGFAVVAQEVRNLASSSAEATKAINARIKGIQNDTNAVVVTIEESTRQVVIQSELASQAGAALGAVDSVTQHIAQSIGEISQTAGQQAQAAAMVARAMDDIAQITTQTRDSMAQMRGSMEHLAALASALLQSIGVFRLGTAYGPLTGELWLGQNGRYPAGTTGQPLLPPGSPETVAEQVTQPMPILSFPGMPQGAPAGPTTQGNGKAVPTGPLPAGLTPAGPQPQRAAITARLPIAGGAERSEPDGATTGAANGLEPYQQQQEHTPDATGADLSELDMPPPPPGLEHWGRR